MDTGVDRDELDRKTWKRAFPPQHALRNSPSCDELDFEQCKMQIATDARYTKVDSTTDVAS